MKKAIFFTVFAAYMVTTSREVPWGDAHGMYDVAENLVVSRSIAIGFPWPIDIPKGRNGKYYGITPIGTSLVHLPGVLIEQAAAGIKPELRPIVKPIAAHIAPSALGALTCVLFFLLCRQLGASVRSSSITTALLAFASTLWVYSHYPYSEILQTAAFTGFCLQVLRTADEPTRKNGIYFGLWAGALLNTKYVFALAIALCGLYLCWLLRQRLRELREVLMWAAICGLPFVLLAAGYNYARWGSFTKSGYETYIDVFFGGSVFAGVWGMLLSPNKSAFLYSPPLVLALFGLARAPRRYLGLAAVGFLPLFVLYASYKAWSGDYAWGPRFFVFGVPLLLAPAALVLDRLARIPRTSILAALFAAGVAVQILGLSFYWDQWIRISMTARNQWLGNPNRSGANIPDRGRGHCDSCFEDMYPIQWLPAFHPMAGHWWLLKSAVRKLDATAAEAKAPWHAYTSLHVNVSDLYNHTRVDWWGFLWIVDVPGHKVFGVTVLLLLLAGVGISASIWLRRHRMVTNE
jgi:hypothetical protein